MAFLPGGTGPRARRCPIPAIPNPHDRFFKEVFSRPEVAEDFLLHVLPAEVSNLVRSGTFQLRKDSFVDAGLREYFSDLLYQVDFKEKDQGFLHILFEHKNRPAPGISFQLLRYMTRTLEYSCKESGLPLTPIFPVVLYHGTAKWSIPLNFASLYRGPESLRPRLLDFTYCLVDLSTFTDEELTVDALTTLGLLLLKHIHRDDLVERLGNMFRLFRPMDRQTALEFLETVLRYLGAATDRVTAEDCREALQGPLTDRGELRMDEYRLIDGLIADHLARNRPKWMREAMEEGLEEGRKEGTASITIRLLSRKFGCLDNALEERVRQLPLEELELLGDALLDLPSESALAEWLDRRATH
ncbi:MAG: Rpn family recombination-promoting nuclease/putative transposase [Thermodesulfobacteriota bacterium]